jgi:hypothetical protein
LLAPLAKSAGGTQQCGRAVFASTDDPDYQRILTTFEPLQKLLNTRPRADMPGFRLECEVTADARRRSKDDVSRLRLRQF